MGIRLTTKCMLTMAFWILVLTAMSACVSTIAHDKHSVFVDGDVCIIPYEGYTYQTCSQIDAFIDGEPLAIPAGFHTDLASIPRPLWTIFDSPARSEFMIPSIIHDYFYRCESRYSRKDIDDIFYHLLIDNGVSEFKSQRMYLGVRAIGWSAYKKTPCIIQGS